MANPAKSLSRYRAWARPARCRYSHGSLVSRRLGLYPPAHPPCATAAFPVFVALAAALLRWPVAGFGFRVQAWAGRSSLCFALHLTPEQVDFAVCSL
jgi:hypothetical protein